MPNLIERLDALSEAAPIEGTLIISGTGYALDSDRSIVAPDGLQGPTAEFVVALVNAYRDGTIREALRDAGRYRWWRENADAIAEDGDGVIGVAFSYQINILDRDNSTPELMDLIADTAIAQEQSALGRDGVGDG